MPKKKKAGKNARNKGPVAERALLTKDESQEYARIEKKLGGCHMEVYSFDGRTLRAHIRGAMRKRCWMEPGDHVLIALRDFGDEADIIHKYNEDEVRRLKKMGELIDLGEKQKPEWGQEVSSSDETGFDIEDV